MNKLLCTIFCALTTITIYAQTLVINEVMYRRPQASEQIRFVELYNNSNSSINLSNYFLEGDVNYQFPNGSVIGANEYVLVAENPAALQNNFNIPVSVFGPWQGTLTLQEGSINLRDNSFNKLDGVDYSGWHLFPSSDIDSGRSIQKMNPNLGSTAGCWDKSSPTPGIKNSAVYRLDYAAIPIITAFKHQPERPKPNEPVIIQAAIDNALNLANLSIQVEYQIVNPGNYIEREEANYYNGWLPLTMNDNGVNGDTKANDGIFSTTIAANIQTNRRLIRYRIRLNNNLNYNRLFPDQDFDEANFSYFVYNKHNNVNGYDINELEDLQTFIFISKGVNDSDQNYSGTVVTEDAVYDHVVLRRTRFYFIQSDRRNYRANFNDGRSIYVKNDEGKAYHFPKDRLQLSSTEMNDLNSHGLIESVIFKIFELNNVVASYADYTHLRFIDSPNANDDYEGIHVMRDYIRGFKEFKTDFLQQRNLPDGNIYGYRFPFGILYDGDLAPYGINNSSFNTWNNEWDNLVDGCSSCSLPIPSQSFLENNIDLDIHYGFMASQEIIANNETNYAGQHNHYDYYNPVTQKYSVIPDDMNATFGVPRDEDGFADRSEWNPYENIRGPFKAAITNYDPLRINFENNLRSTVDLLLNNQQLNFLVDNESKRIFQASNTFNWTDVDRSKWNQQYNNYEDVKQDYKNFFAKRKTYLENTYGSSKMPEKPTINYTGPSGFPLNELTFSSSDFNDPQGNNTFAALEWRVGEWSNPNNAAYHTITEDIYEITPVWQSGELGNFSNTVNIDAFNLKPGRSYKVRVRYKDNTGRWSYWSEPIEFIAGNPVNYNSPDIKFTEIMFNPSVNCGTEFIEIYNNTNSTQDLSYYTITGAVEYQFAEGASIAANTYMVLAKDSVSFYFKYGFAPYGEFSGDLSNTNDQINLTGYYNQPLNSVNYTSNLPWPQNANGSSFALKAVNLNNTNGQNWKLENYCGSPAAANSIVNCNLLSVSDTITNQSCFDIADGSIFLQASGGNPPYSYVWSNGLTGSSISNLSGGNYTTEITDNSGCLLMKTYTILSQAPLNISKIVNDISYYALNDGSINITLTGGTAPYTYSWSNGATTANLNNLAAGTYNLTIVDANGCEVFDSTAIQDVDCNSLNAISSATNQSYYQTNNGTASLNILGGTTPYTVNWSNGATSLNLSNLSPGIYSATIIDAVGCNLNETVSINPIICNTINVQVTTKHESCDSDADGSLQIAGIQNGTAPYTTVWSTGITGTVTNNLAGGMYQLDITDAVGCTSNTSYTINAAPSITVTPVITNTTAPSSNNGAINLVVNGGTVPYTFNWSNTATTKNVNNLIMGTYWVNVTDANNCLFILNNIQVDSECSISVIQQNQPNLATGIFQAAEFIQSNGTVNTNQSVSFKAGICIELSNNFEVASEATFEAQIGGCD